MTTKKKGWFERNQGLITFLGYLLTVIIGGASLLYSNIKSSEALTQSRDQFRYEISKDSLSKIALLKSDSESKVKFKYQDSLNKRQDNINSEQLKNFKSQTLTGEEQLVYFKEQTQIAEMQLKNAEIIYQEQLDENKPSFIIQDFTIDSILNKPRLTLKFTFINSGKRDAIVKKFGVFVWDIQSNVVSSRNIPVDEDPMIPMAQSNGVSTIVTNVKIARGTLFMIQIIYKDRLAQGLLTYRASMRFANVNPVVAAQIDADTQKKFLLRMADAEIHDKNKYLTY